MAHRLRRLKPGVACFVAAVIAASAFAKEPLTTVAQVRALSPEEADRALPVRIRGRIAYSDASWNVTFFHDGKHGIYIRHKEGLPLFQELASGDEVEVTGATARGDFLPLIQGAGEGNVQMRLLGHRRMEEPATMDPASFSAPGLDCEWVRLSGVIRSVRGGDRLALELDVDGRRILAHLPRRYGPADIPAALVGRTVHASGVVGTRFNGQRQMTGRFLYIPQPDHIRRDEPEALEADPFDLPLQSSGAMLRLHGGPAGSQRIRLKGVVTARIDGRGLFLRGEGGGVWVQPIRPPEAAVGDVLEAAGLPEVADFKPELHAAFTRLVGREAPPVPVPIAAGEALDGRYHAELVSVEGTLTAHEMSGGGLRLFLTSEGTPFEVQLPAGAPAPPPAESRLRATGICLVVLPPEFRGVHRGRTFLLQSRDGADLAVLSMPPWWTARRLLWALAGVAGLATLVVAWAFALRRRVTAQTATIRDQLERETILEERQRIARDWHDTMEQQLMGVHLLLGDVTAQLPRGETPAAATESLGLARRMLGYCREESRASIRDLRSLTLETRGLPAALEEFLRPLARAAGAEFSLAVTGVPGGLTAAREQHLLRLAQEAVANAARHACAREIHLSLDYFPGEVRLEVRDDGSGFDPVAAARGASDGHFGLQGMTERAEKIQGRCTVESSREGGGTRVTITAPLDLPGVHASPLPS